ncbi:hypothetical protein HN028_14275 [Pantoea ananatis]|uniref:hypothetical protein n=1 Tax=Pantoea ananas TaxID=553 RepID=UPI00352B9595
MFEFSKKQRLNFLKRFGIEVRINSKNTLAIPERTTTDENGQVSETLYVTADIDDVKQDFVVVIDGENYRIAYINNDNSGLVNCYLSTQGEQNGRKSKYR